MAPSEGPGGDPAAEEGPTSVTRSSRSGPTTTRYLGDRPAAATRAGECDADGVEEEEEGVVARRGYYPNPAPRRSTPAAGEGGSRSLGKRVLSGKEAVPRCGCYGDTPPRRPRPFGEGTSAAGAEAAVLTCGCYRDTPPQRLVDANSTRLGHKGGVPRCIPTLVRPGSNPTPCVQNQLASGGGRGQRDSYSYDGTSEPHAPAADLPAKIGSEMDAASCIPVVAGGRGDGGGRGDRDGYIYGCTTRPHTFMPAPTSDLAPKDKATSQTIECMEEGYLAKIVQGDVAKAIKVGEVICVTTEEEVDMEKFEDFKPLAADSPAAPSLSIATPEPAEPKLEEKVPANAPEPKALKANAVFGLNVKSMLGEIDSSELPEYIDGSFICSDKGGCLGSNKRMLKDNYITKMDFYLKADSMSEDMKLLSDGEEANNYSLRFEELKGKQGVAKHFCTGPLPTYDESESENRGYFCALCGSFKNMKKRRDETQIFMDICGSIVSLQKDLSKVDINMLSEAAFVKVGIKPSDFYSTYAGKVLEPNRLLSCYQIPRDSTIKLNARLRGGCADRNWDTVIGNRDRYQIVHLADKDLRLPEQIIDPQVEMEVEVKDKVKYLADFLRVRCRKVLIYLCRKHYSGFSFGGDFSSLQIMFDNDGNVRIDAAPQHYSQPSALLDYHVVSENFDRALGHAADKDPTHFRHLICFLSVKGPVVDCQSKGVIAFVTNHISLLTYSERIQHTSVLDLFITRLGEDDRVALIKILVPFDWGSRVEKIQAMSETYYFVWWYDNAGTQTVPYKKHGRFPLDELEAAFSLATADLDFLAHLLFKILIRFKSKCQQPCPASIEAFVDKVIKMLGDHTIDCEKVQVN